MDHIFKFFLSAVLYPLHPYPSLDSADFYFCISWIVYSFSLILWCGSLIGRKSVFLRPFFVFSHFLFNYVLHITSAIILSLSVFLFNACCLLTLYCVCKISTLIFPSNFLVTVFTQNLSFEEDKP